MVNSKCKVICYWQCYTKNCFFFLPVTVHVNYCNRETFRASTHFLFFCPFDLKSTVKHCLSTGKMPMKCSYIRRENSVNCKRDVSEILQ